jgi:hypothetical protein
MSEWIMLGAAINPLINMSDSPIAETNFYAGENYSEYSLT